MGVGGVGVVGGDEGELECSGCRILWRIELGESRGLGEIVDDPPVRRSVRVVDDDMFPFVFGIGWCQSFDDGCTLGTGA